MSCVVLAGTVSVCSFDRVLLLFSAPDFCYYYQATKDSRATKIRQDKTGQDKTRQDKTSQEKTIQDKTRQDKTGYGTVTYLKQIVFWCKARE